MVMSIVAERSHRACIRVVIMCIMCILQNWFSGKKRLELRCWWGGGFGGVHMCLCVSLHVCEQE